MKSAIEKIAKGMPARERDVIDVRDKHFAPTPEQMRHARYVEGDIVDTKPGGKSITIGKAFRKEAKFERIKGLGDEQLKALRYYREAFDMSEASEVKSALDVRPRGNSGLCSQEVWVERQAGARVRMAALESGIGGALHTLRDVALRDMTFSELAIKRYGSVRRASSVQFTMHDPTQLLRSQSSGVACNSTRASPSHDREADVIASMPSAQLWAVRRNHAFGAASRKAIRSRIAPSSIAAMIAQRGPCSHCCQKSRRSASMLANPIRPAP